MTSQLLTPLALVYNNVSPLYPKPPRIYLHQRAVYNWQEVGINLGSPDVWDVTLLCVKYSGRFERSWCPHI